MEKWSTSFKGLKISCRQVNQDAAIFLITYEEKVAAQFPIELYFLRNRNLFRNEIQYIQTTNYGKRKLAQKRWKISKLQYGIRDVNLKAKIIEISPAQQAHTRFGTTASISNVKITDETGSIRLTLWND